MWLITALVVILVALLLVVIVNTSMKLALMITTLYNYESKKLFIPATLTVILWAALLFGCYRTINTAMDNNAMDILFSMIFDHALLEQYKLVIIKPLVSTFLLGTFLQSFTYYTVNINYQRITGSVRFSIKRFITFIAKKLFKKDLKFGKSKVALSEIHRGPKKLTFIRAIITSIITIIVTIFICIILFFVGHSLSKKVLKM